LFCFTKNPPRGGFFVGRGFWAACQASDNFFTRTASKAHRPAARKRRSLQDVKTSHLNPPMNTLLLLLSLALAVFLLAAVWWPEKF